MSSVAWLHLSDWHQGDPEFNRKTMRGELLSDIRKRHKDLQRLDFILFSGDISHSGAKEEFEAATRELIDPVREIVGRDVPIYCVPGNHDIERKRTADIPPALRQQIANIASTEDWHRFNDTIDQPGTAANLNIPLTNYYDFLVALGCKSDRSKLYSVERIEKDGVKIGILCINTAWNSARFQINHKEHAGDPGASSRLWDYGLLRITEAQLQQAINELGGVHLGILMMHHPLHWIDEFDRARLEQKFFKHSHIVVHGHEHRPNTSRVSGAFGDLVFIPAGAAYIGAITEDPRYTNAYNFCRVDTNKFVGTVYHRVWSEETGAWKPDERFWSGGQSQFLLAKNKNYNSELVHRFGIVSSKKYSDYIYRRVALEHEVEIRHEPVTVDGEEFIHVHAKIRMRLAAGDAEPFQFRTGIDEMILEHPNKNVRKRAYKCLHVSPEMQEVPRDEKNKNIIQWKCTISPDEQWVEHEYEKLELPNNFWQLSFHRFAERVKFQLRGAPGYDYSPLAIGGFPPLKLTRNKVLSVDTFATEEMVLPSQGYIIQWRPKHKPSKKRSKARKQKSAR